MSCSPLRGGLFLIALGLARFGLLPEARAVCQEGCSGSNTFLGEDALILNTGYNNTASGYQALLGNTTGYDNTATGSDALASNNGNYNTATGYLAMSGVSISVESIGFNNTATGAYALKNIFNGQNNTATGYAAMQGSEANLGSSGNNNTASGALRSLATPLAARTRPWVWKPSLATQQPAITLPLAPMHSPSTLRVALTRPPESMPCGSSSCL